MLRGTRKEGFSNVDYKPKGNIQVYSPMMTALEKWYKNSDSLKIQNKNLVNNKNMKVKKQYKKRQKKRKIIKKGIPRTIAPASKLIRCKASNYIAYTCTSGALDMKEVNAVNIVDPFASGSTQQPLGYDQWKSLYRTAYVLGCKVKLTVWNNDTTALIFGITVTDKDQGTTALTNYEYYREVPRTKSRLLSPDVDHGVITNQSSTKRVLKIKDLVDDDSLRTDLSNEIAPSQAYYIHTWVQPLNQAATLSSVPAVIDVEYIVLLTNPVIPARSTA